MQDKNDFRSNTVDPSASLRKLSSNIKDKERRFPIPMTDFLKLTTRIPEIIFRDIFQIFHDMVKHYVPEGIDEYEDREESAGFKKFDCKKLFKENCDTPFFADRLFANRLMGLVDSLRSGTYNNHIILFEGPPGSGKSTFLNNLLLKLEHFSRIPEGAIFKTYWRLDIEKLGGFQRMERRLADNRPLSSEEEVKENLTLSSYPMKYLEFSCPRHDHPILQIPKIYRKEFLKEIIPECSFKDKLFSRKEFEWVFKDIPCSICRSLYETLIDILGDPMEVFNMVYARKNHFNRQFGSGITIFNPGDDVYKKPITNPNLQLWLNELLKSDSVEYIYSVLAKTNNGVYALMDIKENNVERLKNLHGIISDGVHKVEFSEERVKSLFMGLVNPEDKKHYENVESFRDRVITVNIPYVLDYNTEVAIYKDKFGENIESFFLPRVLNNFAKIVISSRLKKRSEAVQSWIKDPSKYSKYQDKDCMLLRMDLYTGKVPTWLSEEDIKTFSRDVRKAILKEAESEGRKGFSGRQSISIFNALLSKYAKKDKHISMEILSKFFSRTDDPVFAEIPDEFLGSLIRLYDYNVLQEIKESIYYYNEQQIFRDLQNYICCLSYDTGETIVCDYTGDRITVSDDFMNGFESILLGKGRNDSYLKQFRDDIRQEYIKSCIAQEIRVQGKVITQTKLFKSLFEKYTDNLKQNALVPYKNNDNFRRAIQDYNTKNFKSYDARMKRDILMLLKNLRNKFGYTENGAIEVSLYAIDKKLVEKYE